MELLDQRDLPCRRRETQALDDIRIVYGLECLRIHYDRSDRDSVLLVAAKIVSKVNLLNAPKQR